MNLADSQERSLAAGEYVLGTLDGDDRRALEQALTTDSVLRAEVYAWQDRLVGLARRVEPVEPKPQLWQRVAQRLTRPNTPAPAEAASPVLPDPAPQAAQAANGGQWRRLWMWQGIGGVAVAASLVLATLLVTRMPVPAEPRYLAVLQAPDQSVGWLVEARAGGAVRLVPMGIPAAVPPGRALQFWTKAQGASGPTSLGLVAPGRVTELPAARLPVLEAQQLFELTLEPEGGSPLDRPTGPVLFLGEQCGYKGGGAINPLLLLSKHNPMVVMLKVHHLGRSQSERILWLCEELELPYKLQHYTRDPVTMLSPPDLKALHPLGAAPLIEDGTLLLAESAAIVEYIIVKHGGGRLKLGPEHPDYATFLYWFHFSNGNLQPVMGRLMMVSRAKLPADHPVQVSVKGRLDRLLALMETRLGETAYLAGRTFTAADIMSVFSLTTMRLFQPVDLAPYRNIRAYLQRIGERPAYQRAMAKGDPDLTPMLS